MLHILLLTSYLTQIISQPVTASSPSLLGLREDLGVQWYLLDPEMKTSTVQKSTACEKHSLEDRDLLVGLVVPEPLVPPVV